MTTRSALIYRNPEDLPDFSGLPENLSTRNSAGAVTERPRSRSPGRFSLVFLWFKGLTLPAAGIMKLARSSYRLWRILARGYLTPLAVLARFNAWAVAHIAQRTVPAYREFLKKQEPAAWRLSLTSFPETDKENYAKASPWALRCRRGRIQVRGTTIDESSGASDKPFNWLRSQQEMKDIDVKIANYVRFEFPSQKLLTLNAFSLGAWSAGINVSRALTRVGMVKSTGPDLDCLVSTLQLFGPGFDYLITAYPPFLKKLCDELDRRGFPWKDYTLYGLVAGEPITEALRDYLERRFKKIRSAYGASDLQIAIAGESDFTVWLRRQLRDHSELRHALLGAREDRIPMIFQYNPFEHFIEINDSSDVVITVNNLSPLCPKIRYNIGDEGRVHSFKEVMRILQTQIPGWKEKAPRFKPHILKLPLLFLFGRNDSSLSYMGANINPQDVEYGLYRDEKFAWRIESFCLSLDESPELTPSPTVNIQLRQGIRLPGEELHRMKDFLESAILDHLCRVSRDFNQAFREDPEGSRIQVRIFSFGTGIFTLPTPGIKNRYLIRGFRPQENTPESS